MSACPSKWFIGINGNPVDSDKPFAYVSPTIRPPINPGPAVTAIPSIF